MNYQNERKARSERKHLSGIRGEGPLDFGEIGPPMGSIYGNPQVMAVDFNLFFKTPE